MPVSPRKDVVYGGGDQSIIYTVGRAGTVLQARLSVVAPDAGVGPRAVTNLDGQWVRPSAAVVQAARRAPDARSAAVAAGPWVALLLAPVEPQVRPVAPDGQAQYAGRAVPTMLPVGRWCRATELQREQRGWGIQLKIWAMSSVGLVPAGPTGACCA